MRSATSNTMRRGISGGARRANKSIGRSTRSRATASTSRKPSVTSSATVGAAALDHGVGGDGGAVHDEHVLIRRKPAVGEQGLEPADDRPRRSRGGVDGTFIAATSP